MSLSVRAYGWKTNYGGNTFRNGAYVGCRLKIRKFSLEVSLVYLFKLACTHKIVFQSVLERFVPCNILKPLRKLRRICTLGKQLQLFMGWPLNDGILLGLSSLLVTHCYKTVHNLDCCYNFFVCTLTNMYLFYGCVEIRSAYLIMFLISQLPGNHIE